MKNVIPLCLTNVAFCFASHFAFSAAVPFSDTDNRLSLALSFGLCCLLHSLRCQSFVKSNRETVFVCVRASQRTGIKSIVSFDVAP